MSKSAIFPLIFIEKPLLWTYVTGNEQWKIEANKGEYDAESNQIKLIDSLQAQLQNSETNRKFNAQDLMINLENKHAFTDNGITISENQFKLSGQIAKLDLSTNLIEVNKNVKAIYKSAK